MNDVPTQTLMQDCARCGKAVKAATMWKYHDTFICDECDKQVRETLLYDERTNDCTKLIDEAKNNGWSWMFDYCDVDGETDPVLMLIVTKDKGAVER